MPGVGDRARRTAEAAATRALRDLAEQVLEESNRNIGVGDPAVDPDPSFALREHGHIRKRQTRTGVKFTVFYDGPYDVWQHENLHAEHPRGGGPKFLENALKLYMPLIERAVAGEVRQSMPKTRRARGR
jgi:hypothetical protein